MSRPGMPSLSDPTSRERAQRNWAWVMADGVLGVIVGVVALVWPGITVLALALLLGIGLLVQGVFEVSAALGAAKDTGGRGWTAFFGIVAIIAGIICLVQPGAGLFAIELGVTLWFFVAGFHELFAGFYMREHRVWNLVVGVITILLGIVLIAAPGLALSTAAILAGIFFLVRGFGEISLGSNLRRLGRG